MPLAGPARCLSGQMARGPGSDPGFTTAPLKEPSSTTRSPSGSWSQMSTVLSSAMSMHATSPSSFGGTRVRVTVTDREVSSTFGAAISP